MQPSTDRRCRGTLPLVLALALALAIGCSDSTAPTETPMGPTGTPAGPTVSIPVSVITTGANPPGGFVLAIDDSAKRSVEVNDTIVVRDIPGGRHSVWLKGMPANCFASYQPPVTVGAGESPSTAIGVSCFTRSIPPALASTHLVFVRGNTSLQLYRAGADGSDLVALGSGYAPAGHPTGSTSRSRVTVASTSGIR